MTKFASLNIAQIGYLPSGHIGYINLQQLPDYRAFLKEIAIFLLYNSFAVNKMCGQVESILLIAILICLFPLPLHPLRASVPIRVVCVMGRVNARKRAWRWVYD